MDELTEHKAYNVGTNLALIGLIGALIETHPHPEKLVTALERQKQYLLVTLAPSALPEIALDAFHATWERALQQTPPTPAIGAG